MIQILQLIVPLLIAQILYESDSDSESSGLNFESLPVQLNTLSNIKKKAPIPKLIYTHYTLQIPLFSFPWSLCKESNHDSKCCTLCDEWVHRKCTDLTIDQSKTHCSPDHYGDPFYCVNCLFGICTSRQNQQNRISPNATDIELADIYGTINNICPNSVFG